MNAPDAHDRRNPMPQQPARDRTIAETLHHDSIDSSEPLPTEESRAAESSKRRERQLVFGSTPGLGSETRRQLRIRLRAAAILLLLGFVLFLLRDIVLHISGPAGRTIDIGVMLTMAVMVFVLSQFEQLSIRTLRAIELIVFFVPAIYFSYSCLNGIQIAAEQSSALYAISVVKNTVIGFFALIMIYGMFIPSTGKRALFITATLAIAMPLTMISIRLAYPAVNLFVRDIVGILEVTNNFLILFIGACASVIAAHTFDRLRREAFQAKQLGQYRLRKLIGRGGMGEVYLAEHHFLRRPCAIKILRSDRSIDSDTLARFEREVRLTSRLTHPNTVQVFDYGRDESGTFFYVMEYLPGLSLQEVVERFGPLQPERVVFLMTQICEALAEAESKSLVHRDIKPSNILVTQRGGRYDVAKLVDFGLARPFTHQGDIEVSRVGQITGSPLYLSPEQALGTAPDTRSDIYSLGAVTFFALTGRAPFLGENPMSILVAHARDLPPDLRDLNAGLPDDLADLVARCLQKDAKDRYQTAADLLQALQQSSLANQWSFARAREWWTDHHESFELEHLEQSPPSTTPLIEETVEFDYRPEEGMTSSRAN